MNNRLQTKDLINVGIFTALYFVLFFTTGMLGYIPVFMLLIPFLCPLVTGIVFMLFLTKVKKFGMVTIMGIILCTLMFLTGHPWTTLVFGLVFGFLGDVIISVGDYKSWKFSVLGYIVFSQWLLGGIFPIYFMRKSFFTNIREGYGNAYADALFKVTPAWTFWIIIAFVALGALLGAILGKAALKKHFKRAGIA